MFKLLFLLLNASKFGKALLSAGSMIISVFAYSLIFGWRYAAGFVGLIFVHELGHYLAARQRGLDVGLPTFIPFVGAWIQMKDMPHNAETEAYVGIAGPVVGSLGAFACYVAAHYYQSPLLLALSYSGFVLNLFNLLPLSPLDGGRVTAVISPKIWWLGIPILLALFFVNPSPMFILIALLALPHIWHSLRNEPDATYYHSRMGTKIIYSIFYLGLIVILGIMSYETHQVLTGITSP